MAMHFGKGYLGAGSGGSKPFENRQLGPKAPAAAPEAEAHEPGSNVDEQIHGHLEEMHAATGHAHSHVQHHKDGSHTSHHIGHDGQISGPHHHASSAEMAEHMQAVGGEHDGADQGEDEQEAAE